MPFTRLILSYNAKAEKKIRDYVHLGVLLSYCLFSLSLNLFIRKQHLFFFDPPQVRIIFTVIITLLSFLVYFQVIRKKYAYAIQFVFTVFTFYLIFLSYANGFDSDYTIELLIAAFISCLFIRKQDQLRIYLALLVVCFIVVNFLYRPLIFENFIWNCFSIICIALGLLLFYEYKLISEKKFLFKDNLFATIFNQTSDTLFLIEQSSYTIMGCNNQAGKLLGLSNFYISEKKLPSLLRPSGYYQSWETLIEALQIKDQPWIEIELRQAEKNTSFWARVSISNLEIEGIPYYLINIIDVTELVSKEILLEQNKEMLLKVINLLPHEIYLKDAEGKFILVNETVLKAQQKTLSELTGKTDFDLYPHEQAKLSKQIEQEIIRTGVAQVIPEEYDYNEDGSLSQISYTTKIPFYLPEKNETGILGVHIDITENKLAEKTIRESEAKYKTLLEQASDGIYLSDENGNIIDANSKACEMFGYTKEEFLHKNIQNLTSPELSKATVARVTDKTKQNLLIERTFIKKDGEPFTVEISARVLENGGHQAILRDITERKKLEQTLRENERKFRALIENSSDMIVLLDEDHYVRYISPSALKILSYTEQEVLGRPTSDIIYQEDQPKYKAFLENLCENPGINYYLSDIRVRKSFKEQRYVELVGVNLLKDNVINGIILNFHDVTERKNTEIQLLNTNFELDSFVYRASHDMKAPLRSVMGLINITKMESKDNEELLQYLNMMEVSIIKLDNFLKDLTSFVRNSRLEISPEEVNFEEVINESLNSLKFIENAHIIAIVKKLDLKFKFFSDSGRISTIINNLLSNSFKYHKSIANESYIKISVTTNQDQAIIVIEDNGNGIDKKYQNKIFDMFYRASEKSYGSGLGLYIVKMAVTKLNGNIDLLSEPGEKTIFTVVLPNLNKRD
ncbi:MAG TPA: PAS domain S-box protein [Cytophagaceae bacterium]|nr:PAS domain S-box protein [Cytophagaceae bacterium]